MIVLKKAKKIALSFSRAFLFEEVDIIHTFTCDNGWVFVIDGWLVPKYGYLYSIVNGPIIIVFDKERLKLEYISNDAIACLVGKGEDYGKSLLYFFEFRFSWVKMVFK